MKRVRYLAALALLAPLSGEILNRSTGLSELTSVGVAVAWLLPYSLLIVVLAFLAERAPRPGNVLVLLPVAGLVIEGLLVASFFNPSFSDLSVLSGVGMFAGVQWPWTFSLLASHAMVSFLIPLELASFFRSDDTPIPRFIASAAVLALAALIGVLVLNSGALYGFGRAATLLAIAACVAFFFTIRVPEPQQASAPGGVFFLLGLLFAPLNWLTSFFLAHRALALIFAAQAIFIGGYLIFLWGQWFNARTPRHKRLLFITGYLIPAAVVPELLGRRTLIHDPVGLFTLVLIAVLLVIALRSAASYGTGAG